MTIVTMHGEPSTYSNHSPVTGNHSNLPQKSEEYGKLMQSKLDLYLNEVIRKTIVKKLRKLKYLHNKEIKNVVRTGYHVTVLTSLATLTMVTCLTF